MIFLYLVVPALIWLTPAIYCINMVRKFERRTDLLREFASHSTPYRPRTILLVGAWIPVFNWKLARDMRALWTEVIRDMELQRFEELRRK